MMKNDSFEMKKKIFVDSRILKLIQSLCVGLRVGGHEDKLKVKSNYPVC